jgi:four helix bundle protein
MAGVRRHQDLIAWQRCMELADVVFEITESGRSSKDFKFRDQIRDAAQSAAPLIAEGFVRFLPGDFVRYLRMARAEVAEVQSDLETGRRRNYFSEEQLTRACTVARRAMFLTTRLLQSKLSELEKNQQRRREASRRQSRRHNRI